MLSLLDKRIREKILIDVEKSVVDVYTGFGKRLVTAVLNGNFLRAASISNSSLKSLSSWCIDLSTPSRAELAASRFEARLNIFYPSPHLSLYATEPVLKFSG